MSQSKTTGPARVDAALSICRIIWLAFLITQGLFALVARLNPSQAEQGDPMLTWVMLAVALMAVSVSYVVKQLLLKQAAQKEQVLAAQQAVIVALAICEVAGILGLINHFIFNSAYYGLFFVVAILGIFGHFPRRPFFEAASPPAPIG